MLASVGITSMDLTRLEKSHVKSDWVSNQQAALLQVL